MLDAAGIASLYLKSGMRLLQFLETARPAVIVTDLFMPDTDGLDIIRGVRRLRPEAKLIVMSGQPVWGGLDWLRVATLLGADRCVAKTDLADALVPMLHDMLGAAAHDERQAGQSA